MSKLIDLTGKVFGRWTVIKKDVVRNRNKNLRWICRCDCGAVKDVNGKTLKNGGSTSCGCYRREVVTSHGMKHTRFYRIWRGMKQRCYDTKADNYHNYGGRGITYCDRWEKFENFRDDMLESYTKHCEEDGEKNTSIDHIETDGNYEPENCRWATRKVQCRNMRTNKLIEYNGERRCVAEWTELYGFKVDTIKFRFTSGWSIEKALTTPVRYRSRNKAT